MAYSTLSVRIPLEIRDKLDELSDATGRTKSFLATEAIKSYLSVQTCQVKAIKNAIEKANSKDAKFVDHSRVKNWVNSWESEMD